MPTLLEFAGVPVPESVDGRSLVPILRGQQVSLRSYLHGEHCPQYDQPQAYHFLTDGKMKYIWRPLDGSEQLFDLNWDPYEMLDFSCDAARTSELESWRRRLIQHLAQRPEGFSDGTRLIPGRPYKANLPHTRKG